MPTRIGSAAELQAAGRKVVAIGEREIGVFYIDDGFVGWYNECPHMGGPVCQGHVFNRVIEPLGENQSSRVQLHHPTDRNIVCPWHGVEFDLRTGRVPANPAMALRAARVEVLDGDVYLHV
jgi:nitrite reductase/ring-hydroxylating ferredoxin subunit